MSEPGIVPLTSNLLVRKGRAMPSLLGSEEQIYWESEQKVLPGALPRRQIVLTERRTHPFGRRAAGWSK